MPRTLLVLVPHSIYPPNDGGRQGIYYRLKEYAAQKLRFGIDKIVLFIVVANDEEVSANKSLIRDFDEVVVIRRKPLSPFDVISSKPYTVLIRSPRELKRQLTFYEQRYSSEELVLLVESSYMFTASQWCRAPYRFMKVHNIEATFIANKYRTYSNYSYKRLFYFIEYLKMKRFEKAIFRRKSFHKYFFVSLNELQNTQARYGDGNNSRSYFFSPPGVECVRYLNPAAPSKKSPRLIFFGSGKEQYNLFSIQNFINRQYQVIKCHFPDSQLIICGSGYDRLKNIDDSIHVRGFVENLAFEIENADVIVLPMELGAGAELKFLESMCYNRSVIASNTASEGLTFKAGEDFFLAESGQEYVEALNLIMDNPDLVDQMNRSKLQKLQDYYWSRIAETELREISNTFQQSGNQCNPR